MFYPSQKYNSGMDKRKQAVTVAVRVRPLRPEIGERNSGWNVNDNMLIERANPDSRFSFDYVFTKEQNTREIYDRVVAGPIVQSCMGGFNATVFAYGQTSSGKSFTMLGEGKHVGIVPFAVEDMFSIVAEQQRNGKDFVIKCSMLEIYNEQLRDLLAPSDSPANTLRIVNSPMRGVYVDGAVRQTVTSTEQFINYIHKEAEARRVTAAHSMSDRSSRSHCIVRLDVECWETSGGESKLTDASFESDLRDVDARGNPINIQQSDSLKMSALHLVDLAGSERISKTGATGDRKKEGANINKSLLFLGTVIEKLSDPENRKKGHIPYRDSMLTRILQTALGGNSVTTVIAAITEAEEHLEETRSTLKFAFRASQVKNVIHRNEINDDKSRIKNLEKEAKEIRKSLVGKQLLLLSYKLKLRKYQLSGGEIGVKSEHKMISSLQITNNKLTEELDTLRQHGGGVGGTSQTVDQLNAKIEMLENQIKDLEEESTQLQASQEDLEKLCDELESDNDLKTKKADRFRKEKRLANEEVENSKNLIQELQDKVYQLSLGNKQHSQQLEAELGKARSHNDSDLQHEVADARSKIIDLEQKYAILQDQHVESEALHRKGAASLQEHDREATKEMDKARETAKQQTRLCRKLLRLGQLASGKKLKEDEEEEEENGEPILVKEREVDQTERQLRHLIDGNKNKPPAIVSSSGASQLEGDSNQIQSSLKELQGALEKRAAVTTYVEEDEEFPDIPVKIKGMSLDGEKPASRPTRRTPTAAIYKDPIDQSVILNDTRNDDVVELTQRIAVLESSLAQRDSHRDVIIDTKLKRMQDLVIRLHNNNLNLQSEVSRLADDSIQLKEFITQRKLTNKLPSSLQSPTLSGSEIIAAAHNKPIFEHPTWKK